MEEKIINRITKPYQLEFSERNYKECLLKAKRAYRLLEKDINKGYKEEHHIYMTLLTIIRCKINLGQNKTKNILKYMLIGLCYSQNENDRMFMCYLIGKYYEWMGNNIKNKYYVNIVNKYEIEINKKGYFSKTYKKFINI